MPNHSCGFGPDGMCDVCKELDASNLGVGCPDTEDAKHCLIKQRDGFVCAPCGAVLDSAKGHHVVHDMTRTEADRG